LSAVTVITLKFQERITRSECVYNCRVQRETCNSGNASHGDTFDVSVLTTTKNNKFVSRQRQAQ